MVGDVTLDLDHPVRHLLADEGEGLCLQLVFEAICHLGRLARKSAVNVT